MKKTSLTALLMVAVSTPAQAGVGPGVSMEGLTDEPVETDAAAKKRLEAIEALKPVVAAASPARKPELLFRLGELHWAHAKYLLRKEMLAHDTAYVDWIDRGQRGEPPELSAFTRKSQAYKRTAVSLYRRVLDQSPAYARAGEVRFHLAYALYDLGRVEEAVRQYQTLTERHPKSRFTPQAFLQLGEHWFASNSLEKARRAYEHAHRGGEGLVRTYALYRLAWCDFNAADYTAGIRRLQTVADRSGPAALKAEAVRDLALFFARAGAVDEALAYFQGPKPLLRMASILDEQGSWEAAAMVKRRVLSAYPDRIDGLAVQVGLIETLARAGQHEELVNEANRLRDFSGDAGAIEPRLKALATDQHRAKRYEVAAALYRAYTARFDDPEVRFYFGSVLFEQEAWRAAAAQLESVTEGPFVEAAARDAVLAREKTLATSEAPQDSRAFIRAVDRFVSIAPKDDSIPPFLFRAAAELRRQGRTKEEQARLERIVQDWPSHELARRSARLILADLEAREAWPALEARARRYLEHFDAGPGFRKTLTRIAQGAAYQRIRTAEARVRELSGQARELGLVEVAESFLQFARKSPRSDFADEALMSAALIYARTDRIDAALEASSLLAEGYADSEHAARNRLLYARLHERIADFENAARMYHQFAVEHPDHPDAPNALLSAGELYLSASQKRSARRALSRYLKRHSDRPEAAETYLTFCSLGRKQAACYRRFREAQPDAPAGMKLRALHAEARARGSTRLLARVAKDYWTLDDEARADPQVRHAAAEAAFETGEETRRRYERLVLSRRTLAKKLDLLDRLVCDPTTGCGTPGRFVRVIQYGDPEYAVAALKRIGDAYMEMAEAFRRAPAPRRLTEEQQALYAAEIQQRIADLETKAIDAFELAVDRGRALEVGGPWVDQASRRLAELDPNRPPAPIVQPTSPLEGLITAPLRTAKSSTVNAPR